MSALATLPVTERARMMRELDLASRLAVKDKTYQQTPIGREVRLWLQTLRFQGSPQTTLDAYEQCLAWFSIDFADLEPEAFCSSDGVALIRDFLVRHWGTSALDTRRARLYALRSFFKWLVEERDLSYSPAARIKPPRAGETLRIAHPATEIIQLISRQPSLREQCALGLCASLAFRKEDLRLLQIRDVDLTRELVWLRHRKGGEDLLLPIGYPQLRDSLYLHIQGDGRAPHEYLLYPRNHRHRPLDRSSLHRWFKRCLERADLPDFPLHELRHTAGDEMWRATGNLVLAQQLLGHKSLETTRRYLHPTPEDLRSGMRLVAASREGEE